MKKARTKAKKQSERLMRYRKNFVFSFLCVSLSLSALQKNVKTETPYSPHFFVKGDLLYWLPEISGLSSNFGSGSVENTTSEGIPSILSTEIDRDPSFQWSPGYRLGLGWQFDPNGWEIGGIWTDFQGKGTKTLNQGSWKVKLQQLELSALYNAYLSSVHLQPFIGLRGASIRQNLYSQVVTDVLSGLKTQTDIRTFQDKQQFYGLGPLFGLNTTYLFNHGLSLYGNFSFALLYGNHHLNFNDQEVLTSVSTPSQIYSTIQKRMRAFDFNLDLSLGVQWEYLFDNACCLTLKLGLENHQYFNQSRLGDALGNLSFSGGIFSLGLGF